MSVNALDSLKSEADKFASVYDWDSATKRIEVFLKTNRGDDGTFELLGDNYYNLAFQQNTRDDFKKAILRAKDAYDAASDKRCKARAALCRYFYSDDPEERRAIIFNECLPASREALNRLEASSPERVLARFYSELMEYLQVACSVSRERKQLMDFLKEGKTLGRNAFLRFKSSSDPETTIPIVSSYSLFLSWASGLFINTEEQKVISDELAPIIETLIRLAELTEDSRLKSLSYEAAGLISAEFKYDFERASFLFEKAIGDSEKTKNSYLIGRYCFDLGYSLGWGSTGKDIIEEKKELDERALASFSRAIKLLKVTLSAHELGVSYQFFVSRSTFLEDNLPNVSEKSQVLERAISLGREGLQYSEFSPLSSVDSSLSSALIDKAEFVSNKEERLVLLTEALDLSRNYSLRIGMLADPDSWSVGLEHSVLGNAKARLSDERTDSDEARMSLLKDSVVDLKKSVEICTKASPSPSRSRMQQIGRRCETLGDTLVKLFNLSKVREDCLEAIKSYDEAARFYSQANLIGVVAPITWKIAKLYDSIEDYSNSSNAFTGASQQYKTASSNQKSLQKSFAELSQYMEAWSKIEESRSYHRDEDYLSSSQKLREAYSLLVRTESFRYLAKHYEAYSKTEEAEDLSRKEKNQEAALSFGLASDLFREAEQGALDHSSETDDLNWANLAKNRGIYCAARKSLDEAKILDRSGQAEASMRKFRTASETLRELSGEASKHGNTSDVEALSLSCEAFATMKEAEIKSSPELYAKAAELFVKAKENNLKQSFVLSCLANATICEAFATGTRFKRTGDVQLYAQIKKQLGAASRYYEEAGFEIASDWTKATEALFDALAYLTAGEGEMDSAKKTQMYHLAEKHLELSARRYGDIGYEKKRAEVLKHLKTARENRELLITPMEALSQTPTVSTSPVSFTRDLAVGLEKFEVANLSGNMNLSTREVDIGSPVRIDIDIANVGKTPALIMKLENIAPENSFEPEAEKNPYSFLQGGTSLAMDLKGFRLEYLKAHELRLHLKAKSKGTFEIKPKILFVDELGKFRSFEFEAQVVKVKARITLSREVDRKLGAVMFTDISGYTALSQKNEALALELLEEHRGLVRSFIAKHRGREIKTIGDAFLVEFSSSLEAVKCAIDVQKLFLMLNSARPLERQIKLRIGIHLGDVVHSESDIYGDAVNIASRIEPLASPYEICISEQVYHDVNNKILAPDGYPVKNLGKVSLKNVESPIEVYTITIPP